MTDPITLDGSHLTLDDVVAIAQGAPATLAPDAVPRIQRARDAVERFLARGDVIYGVTTGFGAFKDRVIPAERVVELQRNLVRSHAAGVGPALPEPHVRAMLAVRANTLAQGHSGARVEVIQRLLDLLERDVLPVIPAQGSLGASGDLAPLAHLALVLIGEGEAFYHDERLPGGEALRRAGLAPLDLQAKEGLALLNGTTLMTVFACLVTQRAENVLRAADIAGCLSLEALHGTRAAFDARLHAARPHPRQIECAAYLRALLDGSSFVRGHDPLNVQDAYTLRCIPQVHGAVRDAALYARWVTEIELNAATDNPLIFVDEATGEAEVISGGNFHGEPLALALDYLAIALTDLGNMSERRTARLVDTAANGGVLPAFLTRHGGLESGFMIAQYTAAALASENKTLAHPASADTIPTSANTEDHVSMGATAARHAERIVEHVEQIVAIELLAAAQGVDLRREQLGPQARLGRGTAAAHATLRARVPFLEHDAFMAPLIAHAHELLRSGELVEAVEQAVKG
jgi:histidine ammonia-lyase